MPIITPVEAKSKRTKIFYFFVYLILIVGSATMVYPFLMMLSISVKNGVDKREMNVVPRYFYDDQALFQKYIASKYGNLFRCFSAWDVDYYKGPEKITDIKIPTNINYRSLEDYQAFVRDEKPPLHFFKVGHVRLDQDEPRLYRLFRKQIKNKYKNDLALLNREMKMELQSWTAFPQPDQLEGGGYWRSESDMKKPLTPYMQAFVQFKAKRPLKDLMPGNLHLRYVSFLARYYVFSIEKYNSVHGTNHIKWIEIPFPRKKPDDPIQARDWTNYIEIELPPDRLLEDGSLDGPVWRWQDYLERKYSTIANLNSNWGTDYARFDQAKMPVEEHDWIHLKSELWSWRWWFFKQNYAIVADYLLLHGRAIMVTLVYVSLAILTALTLNPMAAYALSRFHLPGTYKILLFCMATMAFPAAVTMIPSFLLIKNLGMLNTFWALVLPGAASGYNIFLLKGFFDALPKELYEAATIDGASEARMFLQVTVPLSKPILALIALQAFTGAYGRFMFAFIICQDPKMWTIMVFLYQFQQQMSISIVFAALTLACIPTLLLFIFCQNIILRGIIVPMEK